MSQPVAGLENLKIKYLKVKCMLRTFFLLQKNNDPNVYYKEKRGTRIHHNNYSTVLVETTFDGAKRFKNIKDIRNTLERYFSNKIKSQLTDLTSGFKVIKHTEQVIITSEEEQLSDETTKLIDEVVQASKLVNETHYSTIELLNKIRKDPELADYKYILSTAYDRLSTSQLMQLFESHDLNPIKYKGNFAFEKEEYLTAAKMICDVPFKSFNLTS